MSAAKQEAAASPWTPFEDRRRARDAGAVLVDHCRVEAVRRTAAGFEVRKLPWPVAAGDPNAVYLAADPVDVMVGAFTYDLARKTGGAALEFL